MALPRVVAPIGFERNPPAVLPVQPRGQLTIGHFGSIYGDRSFAGLLSVCDGLSSSSPRPVIEWYGEFLGDHPMKTMIPQYIRNGTLVMAPPVGYGQARARMAKCDLLLTVPGPEAAQH